MSKFVPGWWGNDEDGNGKRWNCHYGGAGDLLWVKESYCFPRIPPDKHISFRADCPKGAEKFFKWKPSIFMSKEYSRIWLRVKDVRVERLNDMGFSDAVAEGVDKIDGADYWRDYWHERSFRYTDPYASYRSLWEKINGFGTWVLNPWVWVVTFERVSDAWMLEYQKEKNLEMKRALTHPQPFP